MHHLIAHTGKIISKFLDGLGGDTRLDGLRVVGDEDGLDRLDDDDAFFTLMYSINIVYALREEQDGVADLLPV